MDQQATINQLTGVVKLLLTMAGTYLVQRGFIDNASLGELCTGLATLLVTFGWMIWARRANGVIKAAANLPQVQAIVAPSVANQIPLTNVVTSTGKAAELPGVAR